MAIILTEIGVDGILDAIAAAFAFESVTTSAWAYGAAARITAVRMPIHAPVDWLSISFSLCAASQLLLHRLEGALVHIRGLLTN